MKSVEELIRGKRIKKIRQQLILLVLRIIIKITLMDEKKTRIFIFIFVFLNLIKIKYIFLKIMLKTF